MLDGYIRNTRNFKNHTPSNSIDDTYSRSSSIMYSTSKRTRLQKVEKIADLLLRMNTRTFRPPSRAQDSCCSQRPQACFSSIHKVYDRHNGLHPGPWRIRLLLRGPIHQHIDLQKSARRPRRWSNITYRLVLTNTQICGRRTHVSQSQSMFLTRNCRPRFQTHPIHTQPPLRYQVLGLLQDLLKASQGPNGAWIPIIRPLNNFAGGTSRPPVEQKSPEDKFDHSPSDRPDKKSPRNFEFKTLNPC